MPDEPAINDDGQQTSDEALILAVRENSSTAYAQLYERHSNNALATAYRHARNASDAEDLVSEAFANVLQTIKSGKGPTVFFRAYLLTTIRRLAAVSRSSDDKVVPVENLELIEPVEFDPDPAVLAFENTTVTRSFRALPERWQAVLWYTEVDGMAPAAVAPILGMTANAVAALALRAREGLRQSYLQSHLSTEPTTACAMYSEQLGAYVRDSLTPRRAKKVAAHVNSCLRCTEMLLHLEDVGSGMRGVIFPAMVGLAFLGPQTTGVLAAGLALYPNPDGAATGAGGGASGSAGAGAAAGGASMTTVLVASVAGVTLLGAAVAAAVGISGMGSGESTVAAEDAKGMESSAASAPADGGQQAFALPQALGAGQEIVPPESPNILKLPADSGVLFTAAAPQLTGKPASMSSNAAPIAVPSSIRSLAPLETLTPDTLPTVAPTQAPSTSPAPKPTRTASLEPSPTRTLIPTVAPTRTREPSPSPTLEPSPTPTLEPTASPTLGPTPTLEPSPTPTLGPTPTLEPSPSPSATSPVPVPEAEFIAELTNLSAGGPTKLLRLDLQTVNNVPVENVKISLTAYTLFGWQDVVVTAQNGWGCEPANRFGAQWDCHIPSWDGAATSFEISAPKSLLVGIRQLDLTITADNAESVSRSWSSTWSS